MVKKRFLAALRFFAVLRMTIAGLSMSGCSWFVILSETKDLAKMSIKAKGFMMHCTSFLLVIVGKEL